MIGDKTISFKHHLDYDLKIIEFSKNFNHLKTKLKKLLEHLKTIIVLFALGYEKARQESIPNEEQKEHSYHSITS